VAPGPAGEAQENANGISGKAALHPNRLPVPDRRLINSAFTCMPFLTS